MEAEKERVKIFFSYAAEDQKLLEKLEGHMAIAVRQGLITIWHDRKIPLAINRNKETERQLNAARIIVLLVSQPFLEASECANQVTRAMARYSVGEAFVVPVLLRPATDWKKTEFGSLQTLPRNGMPVIRWNDLDEAFSEVAKEILDLVDAVINHEKGVDIAASPLPVDYDLPPGMQSARPAPSITAEQANTATSPPPTEGSALPIRSISDQQAAMPVPSSQTSQRIGNGSSLKPLIVSEQARTKTPPRFSRRTVVVSAVGAGIVAIAAGTIGIFIVSPYKSPTPTSATISKTKAKPDPTAAHHPTPTAQKTSSLPKPFYISQHHKAEVDTVAWSPTANLIASGSRDKTADVWNLETGKIVTYMEHNDWVYCVAWSPDGTLIASASYDQTVHVWDPTTGIDTDLYSGHSAVVLGVAWSPNGKLIASASDDKTVQVWDPSSNAIHVTYHGHRAGVDALAWSPDGTRIASAGKDKTVQVWDASNGNRLFLYPVHTQEVDTVAWSPDGKYIASGSYDKTVQIWDAVKGSANPIYSYKGHADIVRHVAWSPDSTRIASASADRTVHIWDAATGKILSTYRAHTNWVDCAVWSPDGTYVASSGADKSVQVWKPSL